VVSGEPDVEQIPSVLLELRNVDVVFDGIIQVLRSVNIEVPAGKVTALLGGNGAGKTTTVKTISGLLSVEHGKVTEGQIRFRGEDITNADPVQVFRRGIVQVLEGPEGPRASQCRAEPAGRRPSPLRPPGRPRRYRASVHLFSQAARAVQPCLGLLVGR